MDRLTRNVILYPHKETSLLTIYGMEILPGAMRSQISSTFILTQDMKGSKQTLAIWIKG